MVALVFLFFFVVIVVLVIIFSRLSELGGQIRALEEKLYRLSQEIREARPSIEARAPIVPAAERTVSDRVEQAPASEQPVLREAPGPLEPTPPPPPLFTPPPAPPSRTREEWEALIGGKLLNRIGALALVIGIGFFLKYAFDNNWLSETVRVLMGTVAGILLLAGAAQSRKRGLLIFAQGLVGAGIAVLYLSVYASFNYYALVSQPVAFVLMALVTVVAFTQAFLYDSIAVSLLGWVGGFLTPFMLSTGEANEVGLFSYIALLAAGMIVVVMKKEKWTIIEPLTLAATYFIFYLWYGQEYKPADLAPTLFFATLFWALFFVADIINSARQRKTLVELRTVAAAFNAALFYLALFLMIDNGHHAWMGGTTLALGIIYGITALLTRQANPGAPMDFPRLMVTGVVLLIMVPPIEFTRFTIILFWSVEALILVWCSRRWNLRFARITAFVLYGIAAWLLLATEGALFALASENSYTVLFNMRAVGFISLAISMAIGGFLLSGGLLPGTDRAQNQRHPVASMVLLFGWSLLVFIYCTVETNDLFRHFMATAPDETTAILSFQRYVTLAVVWAILGIGYALGARRSAFAPLAYSGIIATLLAVGMAAVRGIAYSPIEQFELILNNRTLALLLVIAATFAMAALIRRMNNLEWGPESTYVVGICSVVLILVLLTGETRDFFEKRLVILIAPGTDEAYDTRALENLKQLSLSGVWLLYSISLMAIGIWQQARSLRIIAIVLFGITILKIFIYDLSFLETLYRIFSFIGLGVVLLAVSYLYQHYKDLIFQEPPKKTEEQEEITA
jgi:uncharacterized membrane protein